MVLLCNAMVTLSIYILEISTYINSWTNETHLGRDDACFFEEVRSKLLLSSVPRKRNCLVELSRRLNLWAQQDLEQLLVRVEEQARGKIIGRRLRTTADSRGRRAKHLVFEGARSRAVTSLTSELACLTTEEEKYFAEVLFPRTVNPDDALSGPLLPVDADEVPEVQCSLKGVRSKALSAPGPTGARPEHLKELLGIKNKRIARRLIQSISKFVEVASKGTLPDAAGFLLDSRLVFLRKKRGRKPRPIRVGELWRRVVAKRLMHDHNADIASMCKSARQFGVGYPGGVDVLVHFRIVFEKIARAGSLDEVMAILDINYKNMFPSIEWKAIREAIAELLP